MAEYDNFRCADIVAEALIDWKVDTIFGLPGDGINGFMEALRTRKDKIKFVLVRHEESAAFMASAYAKYTGKLGACLATSGPGAIHLLNGLYDAKLDGTPVVAITGRTYSDLMGSGYQQDVDQLQLFSDVSVYNNIINKPEQAEMVVDMACRAALSQRGVSHFTMPIDVQEKILEGKYSKHKVPGHTSDKLINFDIMTSSQKTLKDAAEILNAGKKIVIFIGQGALNARNEVLTIAEKLNAPIVKSLLGKAVVEDDNPYNIGILGILGTEPATDAMNEADTLLMVGTSFPYIDYLPKPGQARGIQIDIKPERIGLRYPVEVGLLGDSRITLSALIPLLDSHNKGQKENKNSNNSFLLDKQQAMKEWINKLETFRNRSNNSGEITYNKLIKPQGNSCSCFRRIRRQCNYFYRQWYKYLLGCTSYQC
jgi:pyruvate dehydrogenase (quinone)